jgi:hypothetical protein
METTTTHSEHRSTNLTKPGFVQVAGPCSRCGGAGGSAHWPGFTCFRCGGNCAEPGGFKTFSYPADWTDEQIVAHRDERTAKADARREQAAARKAAQAKTEKTQWLAANPEAAKILKRHAKNDDFVADLARGLDAYGSLTDRQVEVLLQAPTEIKERKAREAAEAKRVAQATPVPTGTEILTGEVATTKWVDNGYGSTLKMLVLEDRGFKVWGSVPSSLNVEQGDRVTFLAAVEPSDDDPLFGFYKRPRKATIVEV